MHNFLNIGTALLARLPAETAHDLTLSLVGRVAPLLPIPLADPPSLRVEALGLSFPNPVGLGAGFDKNAAVSGAMAKLGFGFVECGTVTPRPQAGNPRPRLFRLREDRAVINRMGFNNGGMEAAACRLAGRQAGGIVGINIGANKDSEDRIADYAKAFARLAPLADYVTVNISSPNTPGLRGLQNKEELARLLETLMEIRARLPLACASTQEGEVPVATRSRGGIAAASNVAKGGGGIPILVKIAPDLDGFALDEIAAVALMHGLDGLIVSNTTIARPGLKSAHAGEAGGLSGTPLFAPSTAILRGMRQRVGNRLVLVGVGGIAGGADAYAKIRAGASLVQLYTALVYQGPGLVARIKSELVECLVRDGYDTVAEAVGADA